MMQSVASGTGIVGFCGFVRQNLELVIVLVLLFDPDLLSNAGEGKTSEVLQMLAVDKSEKGLVITSI